MGKFITQTRIVFALYLLLGLLLFSPIFHFQFLSDDWDLVYHADRYDSFVDRFVQNDHQGAVGYSYRPVAGMYLAVLKLLFGLNPTGYHVFFVLLHILNALLVMMLARKLVGRWEGEQVGRYLHWAPFVCGLLFLILPTHVEAVAWIAAGVDVVATFCYLTALLSFMKYLELNRKNYYFASLFLFIVGLLTKEIVITLPIVILLLLIYRTYYQINIGKNTVTNIHDRAISLHNFFDVFRSTIVFFVIAGVYVFLRYHATGSLVGYYGRPSVGMDVLQWIRMVSDLLSSFVSWGSARLRVSAILFHNFHWLVVAFALIILYIQKFYKEYIRVVFAISALFLVSVLPVLPLGFNALSDEGERYGYLPSVFFVTLGVFIIQALFIRHFDESRNQEASTSSSGRDSDWSVGANTKRLFGFSYLFSGFPASPAGGRVKARNDRLKGNAISKVVFLCFCVFVFLYSSYGLNQKLSLWREHQDFNYQILNQLYQLNQGQRIILVGLPDSYSGVQGFRNGIEEGYRLYYGEPIDIVRMPIYTVDNGSVDSVLKITNYQLPIINYTLDDGFNETISNQLFLKTTDKSLRLTGEKTYSDEYISVNFFRWHYDSARSDGVTVIFKDALVSKLRSGEASLIFFNGSRLVDLTIDAAGG